jgi:hypothetical protein
VNVRLTLLRLHLPASVRRSVLRELIAAMARAFERTPPRMDGRSVAALSATAVERSSAWARDAIAGDTDLGELEGRLFAEAFALGARVAHRLRLGGEAEGVAAARLVYEAIGIDFHPGPTGEIFVPRCAFARSYSPDVCRLVSAMDSGLIAGLTGADGLRFTARLTEGAPACRARVLHAGSIP